MERYMFKEEIKKDIEKILEESNLTDKGKKSTLTRWIKEAEDYLMDLQKAYKNEPGQRWLHGDPVTSIRVGNCRRELQVMYKLRYPTKTLVICGDINFTVVPYRIMKIDACYLVEKDKAEEFAENTFWVQKMQKDWMIPEFINVSCLSYQKEFVKPIIIK